MSTTSQTKDSPDSSERTRAARRRSRKVCEHCHARKIRCNIVDAGAPCSNCAYYRVTCALRRRKNQRKETTPPPLSQDESMNPATHTRSASIVTAETTHGGVGYSHLSTSSQVVDESLPIEEPPAKEKCVSDVENLSQQWWSGSRWDGNFTPSLPLADSRLSLDSTCDFSHLTDLDDIFAFTSEFSYDFASRQPDLGSSLFVSTTDAANTGITDIGNSWILGAAPGLCAADQEFLRIQGCFDLPPIATQRHMMRQYFRMVHPNLPILFEDEFWSGWTGETFDLSHFSFLLLRAMMFTVSCYVDTRTLSELGFTSPREARNTYYRQAKLLFDFGIEIDPVANAQACLLLTYMSPSFNKLRVNSSWLNHALRFAKIAKADSYHRFRDEDPPRAKLLKRIWWGVLFRDRIMSLGIRRSLQVHLDASSIWYDDIHALQASDFDSELGQSPVYDLETQLKNIEILKALCRLTSRLSSPLKLLYQNEWLDDRLESVSIALPNTISAINHSLEALRLWHDETIERFPFPVSLDDLHETLCLYVNMLFVYHASATFALNMHLILIHESLPASQELFKIEDSRRALQVANSDLERRLQELVQAINVAASRGSQAESLESRRLDVFVRTLRSQQQKFDGSDFCIDVLNNIIAYAQDDENFTAGMSSWRGNSNGKEASSSHSVEGPSVQGGQQGLEKKLDWGNLVWKRPRLFLRLMLHLDYALCTWGVPQEKHFPPNLRRNAV